MFFTKFGEQVDVAGAVLAEVKIRADHHRASVHPPNDDPGHELLSGLLRPRHVEGHNHCGVHAASSQKIELLFEVGDQRRGRFRPQHRGGVRIERDDAGLDSSGGRCILRGPNHRLVAEVDPVVEADGERMPSRRRGLLVKIANYLHRANTLPPQVRCDHAEGAV